VAELIPPRRDEPQSEGGIPTLRFSEFLERQSDEVNAVVGDLLSALMASPPLSAQDADDLTAFALAPPPLIDRVLEVISVDSAFTTTGSQIIICTNVSDTTITLNATPDDGEQVHIKRQSGPVFVSGAIDGTTGKRIRTKYDAPHLVYTLAAGEWSII
jgi:hypothetical protein